MSLIELQYIQFFYTSSVKNFSNFHLRDISLNVSKGEFLSILGPNGSGKSTLLKIISGILSPVEGKVFLNGKPLSSFSKKKYSKNYSVCSSGWYFNFPFFSI